MLKKEKIKGVRFQSLLPFMIQGKVNCINKRPKLLMGSKVEELFARNAIQAKHLPDAHKLCFLVSYNNMQLPKPLFHHAEEELLAATLALRCQTSRRLRGEQKVHNLPS